VTRIPSRKTNEINISLTTQPMKVKLPGKAVQSSFRITNH
jgi:hypothetical protein